MGGVRVVVAVVLSIISLTVLSLHIALCLHYPSPLFAVTLLLNPSLWLFLGLLGMGCALLLTYRDRQRKVRSGLCTSCHSRYGATVDTKWRSQDVKWRDGHCQRGPSRAIYSYNGKSHNFYASYGTINEKQAMEMKRSSKVQTSADSSRTSKNICCRKAAEKTISQTKQLHNDSHETQVTNKLQDENTINTTTNNSNCNDDATVTKNSNNDSNQNQEEGNSKQSEEGKHTLENEYSDESQSRLTDNTNKDSAEAKNHSVLSLNDDASTETSLSLDDNGSSKDSHPSPKLLLKEKKYCDCLARYGVTSKAALRASIAAGNGFSPAHQRYYHSRRTVGRYNKKLLMQCNLKDPSDVPVELFAAKHSSGDDSSCKSVDSLKSDSSAKSLLSKHQADNGSKADKSEEISQSSKSPRKQNEAVSMENTIEANTAEQRSNHSTDETFESTSISSKSELLPVTHSKAKEVIPKCTATTELMPVKHSPPSPQDTTGLAHWTNLVSPTADAQSDSPNDTTHQEDFSQDLGAHGRDQDGASVSSDSGLLPYNDRTSAGREFLRSPIWRPFRGKKDRKSSSSPGVDEEGALNPGYIEGTDATEADDNSTERASSRGQHRQGHRLKSLFTGRKTSKSKASRSPVASHRRVSSRLLPQTLFEMTTKESPSSSPASPAEKRRASPDSLASSPTTPTDEPLGSASVRKSARVSSSPSTSRRTLSSSTPSLPSSPAKVVRSLVMRNLHKNSRSRKAGSPGLHSDQSRSLKGEPPIHSRMLEEDKSSSNCQTTTSPSVRPKERKKPRTRLKGKYRTGSSDSKLLLSDDGTD